MNTGAQLSYSTPFGHRTSTSEVGSDAARQALPPQGHGADLRRLPPAVRLHGERGLPRGPDAQGRQGAVVREERGARVRQDPVLLPAQLAHRRRCRRARAAGGASTAASSRSTRSSTATRRSPTTRTRRAGASRSRTGLRLMGKTRHLLQARERGDRGTASRRRRTAAGRASRRCTSTRCCRPEKRMAQILETRRLTPVTKLFRIEAPLIAASAQPGQFVMLRVREGGERIPITIADYDRQPARSPSSCRRSARRRTACARSRTGDEILDVAGPMGGHIDIAPGGHVCGVGGGFGSAALLCLMREFTARGDTHHGDPRGAQQGAPHPRRRAAAAVHAPRDLHRRRLGRLQGVRHAAARAADRGRRPGPPRQRRGDRPDGDDARRRGDHAGQGREDAGVDGPAHGRRNGHVRRLPRHRRRQGAVRLRRRPVLRRPRGGLRRGDAAQQGLRARGEAGARPRRMHGNGGLCNADQASGKDPDAGARGPASRPRLPRGERRLHGGPRGLRGRALPALPGRGVRRRLPGERADPGIHPRGGDGRHGRRREDPALGQSAAGDLRARLPAGVAVRVGVQPRQALQPRGDRAPRALRRRLGAHAAPDGEGADHAQGEDRRHRRRALGPGVRRRARAAGLPGHDLRGAARRGRRAPLRHPGIPAAEGSARLGNRRC